MKFGCQVGIFLNSAHLICRSTDISKFFRGSLRLQDNESRLYSRIASHVVNILKNERNRRGKSLLTKLSHNKICHVEYFRDPSLFSLIDSVWSGTRGAVSSQDSESGTQNNNYCLVCS